MRFSDLKETVNHDVFNPAFNDTQFFDGLTYRATSELDHQSKPQFVIKVFDDNFERVGLVKFVLYKDKAGNEWLESLISAIQPEYQGKGIASHIYAYARMLGNTVKPSGDQTAQGRAMWSAWAKSGDAKHLTSNESKFSDYERAVMEGGHSLEKTVRRSALRDVVNEFSITELFEPNKKWQWSFQGSEEAVAVFHVGEVPYMFHAYGTDGQWEVEFKRHGSKLDRMQKFGLTGTGNSAEVMSTVVDIMRAFLDKYKDKIEVLIFSAKEDSRQGLYAKMVKRLLSNWIMKQDKEEFILIAPKQEVEENFADGKIKGKSKPGRVKRAGASCSGSVSDLRQRAKDASGERAKMYHWCANMKSGRAKNESEILEELAAAWKMMQEAGVFRGYPCTKDCSGHAAGYRWADARDITDPNTCPYSNNSFWEGCLAHTDEEE